nr:ribonuclease H-like domain-containing protein [Tanacetum cinerariifolium]
MPLLKKFALLGLETGDEAGVERSTERGSNDTEELVNVLTSLDAANILTSGVQVVSVPPAAEVSAVGVPTGSGLVPTIARDAEIARIHAEEELQMMIDSLNRSNEMIAKHLHEYEQVADELTIGEIEVIKFGDSYEAPQEKSGTGSASESSDKKKGRTVALTTEDMHKRRNDVKARTTLLLALPDEHQLRFNKYKTAQELWGAILKIFGRNEATKKTKKNQLKQQYGNFKAEGSETIE